MPAGLIIAGVAAASTVAGAAISSSAQKNATKQATQAATNATNSNNALTRDIYDQNKGVLSPYIQNGYGANNALSGLLGIGGQPAATPLPANNNALAGPNGQPFYGASGIARDGYQNEYNAQLYNEVPTATWLAPSGQEAGAQTPTGQVQQITQQQPAGAASPYEQAFQNYQNSTGYQFRVGEGYKALNSGYAAKGLLNSGAAQKAALNYGQNIASAEFGNYLGQLTNQQAVGLSAGNALAGVGTNYAANVSANNSALAGVQANAALANGQSTANMWGSIAGAAGQFAGALGSSYGGGATKSTAPLWGKIG